MKSPRASVFDFAHVTRALGYSLAGLRAAWKKETAFRQELALFVVLAPLALWLGRTGIERALMFGTLVMVLVVEVLNSALEAVVDRQGTEHHELAGQAKDMGSAAVLLSMAAAASTWGLILWDRFCG